MSSDRLMGLEYAWAVIFFISFKSPCHSLAAAMSRASDNTTELMCSTTSIFCVDFVEDERGTKLGFKSDHKARRMSVGGRQLKREALKDGCNGDLCFHHRKIIPNACTWTPPERQESQPVLRCFRHPLCKSFRLELPGVGPPHVGISLNKKRRQYKDNIRRQLHFA
nr:Os01g0602433 [Ipomoea batatas]